MIFPYIFEFSVKNLLRKTKKGKIMKNLLSSTLILLFPTLFIAILPTDAEAKIYDDTLRLHILANSDSAEDQNLKIEISTIGPKRVEEIHVTVIENEEEDAE